MSNSMRAVIMMMFGYLVVGDAAGKLVNYMSGTYPVVTCIREEDKK